MARNGVLEDGVGRAVEELAKYGAWPLAAVILGGLLIWRLPMIITAATNAWKIGVETRQKLRHKQEEFRRKLHGSEKPTAPAKRR